MICHATVRFSSTLEASIELPDDLNRVELGNIKSLVLERLYQRHPELRAGPNRTVHLVMLNFEEKK